MLGRREHERATARASRRVLVSMLAAIVAVTGLAWWDEAREAEAALRDLEHEQTILASSLAAGLRAHFAALERAATLAGALGTGALAGRYDPVRIRAAGAPRAAPTDPARVVMTFPLAGERAVDLGVSLGELLDGSRDLATGPDAASDLAVFVSAPGDADLRSGDGRVGSSARVRDALAGGRPALRLGRGEALELGLRERTAIAGLARVDAGPLGRWGVVAVASAARERDREKRASWRLVSSVLVASGLVVVFGGVALRKQRKGFELAHRLTVSELEHERDERLSRAERVATMGTFAMGVAHEVSTPLGVIVGRAEQLLARLRDDERATRGAEAILQQADRIQHIVRRFLDMARGGPLSFARTDAADVVRAAAAAVDHRFSRAGVSLEADIAEPMPPIRCDRDLLEQAIVNLLLNACEACAPGGHVQLSARSDSDRVAFVVTDDGVGIRVEDAARATEPFFTTKPAGSGTGLGLAIAAEIAKSHRGELKVEPNVGGGTQARIEIPAAAPAPDPTDRSSAA